MSNEIRYTVSVSATRTLKNNRRHDSRQFWPVRGGSRSKAARVRLPSVSYIYISAHKLSKYLFCLIWSNCIFRLVSISYNVLLISILYEYNNNSFFFFFLSNECFKSLKCKFLFNLNTILLFCLVIVLFNRASDKRLKVVLNLKIMMLTKALQILLFISSGPKKTTEKSENNHNRVMR